MADISFVGEEIVATGSGFFVSVPAPAGIEEDDFLITVVASEDGSGATIFPFSSWTLLARQNNGGDLALAVYYRVATASEPGNYWWFVSPDSVVSTTAYRGVDPGNPISTATFNTGVGNTVTAPSQTTDIDDAWLFTAYAIRRGAGFTAPAGMTLRNADSVGSSGNGLGLGVADEFYSTAGVTGAKSATSNFSGGGNPANIGASFYLRPLVIPPLADYRFDACSYDGSAGEVLDSANSYHGTAQFGVTTDTGGTSVIGYHLDLTDAQHYVANSVPIGNEWTVMTWFQKPFTSAGSRYHILGAIAGGSDIIFLDRNQNFRWGVYTSSPAGTTSGSFRFGTLGDGWHHVAVVGSGGNTSLYIDGAFVESIGRQSTGTLAFVGTSYDSAGTASAQGFRAPLDEYKIYDSPLGPAAISTIHDNELAGLNHDGSARAAVAPCVGTVLDSFVIDVGSAASTCQAHPLTITAYDTDGDVYTDYSGTITLSTSSGHGDWSGNGTTNAVANGTADDGAATYAFDPADGGSIDLDLANVHADDLTITVSDGAAGVSETSTVVNFRDNAFVISATSGDGTEVIAGRPHELRIQAIARDADSNECVVPIYDDGAQGLKAWITRVAPDPGGTVPSINGDNLADGSAPAGNNITLDFSAGGVLRFNYDTVDVGKYFITIRDDTSGFLVDENGNPRSMEGSSEVLTVRPWLLRLGDIVDGGGNANQAGTDPGDDVFTCAGCYFQSDVTGILWQSADDADDDLAPDAGANLDDNAAAASFAWDTTLSAAMPITPATDGTLGAFGNGAIAQADYAGGTATPNQLSYSEVGSVTMTGDVSDYLGTVGVNVSAANAVLGRFIPDSIDISFDNTPDFAVGCGAMTYVGQPFAFNTAPQVTISARAHANIGAGVTTNYEGDFWKLGSELTQGVDGFSYGNNVVDTTLNAPGDAHSYGSLDNINGVLTFSLHAGGQTFSYDADTLPAAPFDADASLSIALTDDDSVTGSASLDNIGFSVDTPDAGGDFNTTNDQLIRYGRMRLGNAYGSELLNLPVVMQVEYYDGTTWLVNTVDGCSEATLSFSDVDAGDGLDATTELCVLDSGSPGASGVGCASAAGADAYVENPPSAGDFNLTVQAPGAGNTGAADITAAVEAWLQYDWNGDGSAQNPAGRLVFGRYRGSDRTIFRSSGW